MAAEWLEAAKELIRSPRLSCGVWVISGLILVAPLPEFLGLDGIRDENRKWIGLACISAFGIWSMELAGLGIHKISIVRNRWAEEKEALKHLRSLTWHENSLLYHAVVQESQTIDCDTEYNYAASLVAKGLVRPVKDGKNGFTDSIMRNESVPSSRHSNSP